MVALGRGLGSETRFSHRTIGGVGGMKPPCGGDLFGPPGSEPSGREGQEKGWGKTACSPRQSRRRRSAGRPVRLGGFSQLIPSAPQHGKGFFTMRKTTHPRMRRAPKPCAPHLAFPAGRVDITDCPHRTRTSKKGQAPPCPEVRTTPGRLFPPASFQAGLGKRRAHLPSAPAPLAGPPRPTPGSAWAQERAWNHTGSTGSQHGLPPMPQALRPQTASQLVGN